MGNIRCVRCERYRDRADFDQEASDLLGEMVCDECAEEVMEENGQFGVGA